MAPELSLTAAGAPLLSWLEPTEDGHALYLSRLTDGGWNAPHEVVTGPAFFANWADRPRVVATTDGTYFAHWLEKLGEDTYAYGVRVSRSRDEGRSWSSLGLLHDDETPTEHGFVSYAPDSAGGLQTFWLDGRAMLDGGAMQLRTTRLDGTGPGASTLLDDRVCECCPTDAATTSDGAVVVYRDRSDDEIRDISIVRSVGVDWSEPRRIHDDGWQIDGCPVNGPAVASDGSRVAVAWFTAPEGSARVQVAFSKDGGASFAEPIVVDSTRPLGRVDLSIVDDGAWVSWLARRDDETGAGGAEIRWAQVSRRGALGPARVISSTSPGRSSGVPRMVRSAQRGVFVWVHDGESSLLRAGVIPSK